MLVSQNALDAKCLWTVITKGFDRPLNVILTFLLCRKTALLVDITYSINSFYLPKILHQLGFVLLVKVRFIWKQKRALHSVWVDFAHFGIRDYILFQAFCQPKTIVTITQLYFELAFKHLERVLLILNETTRTDFLFKVFNFLLRCERYYFWRERLVLRFIWILKCNGIDSLCLLIWLRRINADTSIGLWLHQYLLLVWDFHRLDLTLNFLFFLGGLVESFFRFRDRSFPFLLRAKLWNDNFTVL